MRRLLLLLTGTAAMSAAGAPPTDIRTGAQPQARVIAETCWYSGFIATSAAFLVGEVQDVSSDVHTTPRQTWLSESCELRVQSAWGDLDQIQGIALAKLTSGHESSPYEPVDPAWGRLRHMKKGQKLLILLHEYEGDPCFGSEALIELTESVRTLPEIFRRTALQPALFTGEDLEVVKMASPFLHEHLVAERNAMAENAIATAPPRSSSAWAVAAVLAGLALVVFAGRRLMSRRAQ